MKKFTLATIAVALFTTVAFSQQLVQSDTENTQPEKQKVDRPHSIGSSLWVLANALPDPEHFYQLSYGYQFTPKDNVIMEGITWTYDEPLGEYGSTDKEGEFYPGKVKAYSIGEGNKRFHCKKFFITVQATNFLQQLYDTDDKRIQKGYRIEIFKKSLIIKLSPV